VRVRLHPGASNDLAAAGDWYEAQLAGLGGDLAEEVGHALDAIAEHPMTWPVWPGMNEGTGVRRFLLARFPFAVGYIVEGDAVVVLAFAHQRRRPGYWLERLPTER
jgi:plasmid stabilization system protein ParE